MNITRWVAEAFRNPVNFGKLHIPHMRQNYFKGTLGPICNNCHCIYNLGK